MCILRGGSARVDLIFNIVPAVFLTVVFEALFFEIVPFAYLFHMMDPEKHNVYKRFWDCIDPECVHHVAYLLLMKTTFHFDPGSK